jgi:hypothetical protein
MFLFTGVFDFGFHAYALVSVENAARVAALHTSANTSTASDQSGACALAIDALRGLPNIGTSFSSTCNADPLTVTAAYCDGTTLCGSGSASADGGPAAFVTVTYRMPALFRLPIPGLIRLTRTAEMRLRDKGL